MSNHNTQKDTTCGGRDGFIRDSSTVDRIVPRFGQLGPGHCVPPGTFHNAKIHDGGTGYAKAGKKSLSLSVA
jgi:hypothetical protein